MRRARGWLFPLLCAGLFTLEACEGRPRFDSRNGSGSPSEPSNGPAIAILDLSDGVPEQDSSGFLGLSARSSSIEDVVEQVERLDREADIRGVLVRLGNARVGLGRASEIGSVLAWLRTRHPVWCYADEYDNGSLLLAARGCQRIWAAPASSIDAIGLAAQTFYFHELLASDLKLDVDFLQVGKFKGAEEPFTRDGPTAEARESLESTLAGMRAAWLEGIGQGRAHLSDGAPESGPYPPEEAKEQGLVDDVGYFDAARTALEKAAGAVRAEVRLGPGAASGPGDDFVAIARALAGESLVSAPVVIVRASGAISMDGGGLVGGAEGIVARRLLRVLSRLEGDDDVKAVVLRIDSPGGSALASDLLWHALMRLRAKKPLVVSIGDMAASGGYYLASSGAVIFASETSIVGSIGVVGGKIAADKALEKIGIHAQTFPAKLGDPEAAPRAAYESLFVPWDDATRARVLDTMNRIYTLFLERVAEGRRIPVERVAASAEGRIFSGRDGKPRGLVDELGGLREAIARARELASLPADARIGVADESAGLLRMMGGDDTRMSATGLPVSPALSDALGGLASFLNSLTPLARNEAVACALPFALAVR